MRVMLWTEAFWPTIGGSEVAATTLIDALRARGHTFAVVTPRGADTPDTHTDYHGTPVLRVPVQDDFYGSPTGIGIEAMMLRQRVGRLKQQFQPDLVHVSLPGPSTILHKWTTPSVVDCPTLVSMHVAFNEAEIKDRSWSVRTTVDADWITTCSRDLLSKTTRALPEVADRISVAYNGLPMPALEPAPLPFDPPRLFAAGRIVEQKGFEYAVEALPRLRERFPGIRLTIAGDGELRSHIESLAAELNVSEALEVLGWVDPSEIPTWINRSTVVLMPSRWEPFGLTALQAAQLARPAVVAAVDGLPEVVEDGVTGRLHKPHDVDSLIEAVTGVLTDPQRAAALGRAGRQRTA
ncbi:MAG: glycosyltransferase family 4 protein, partial [Phycisphaeraceae bacterium]